MDRGRLLGNIHHVRHAGLHPVSQFIGSDASGDFRITQNVIMHLVEVADGIERLAPAFLIHARGIGHEEHRITLRAKRHALVDRRKKPASPGVDG